MLQLVPLCSCNFWPSLVGVGAIPIAVRPRDFLQLFTLNNGAEYAAWRLQSRSTPLSALRTSDFITPLTILLFFSAVRTLQQHTATVMVATARIVAARCPRCVLLVAFGGRQDSTRQIVQTVWYTSPKFPHLIRLFYWNHMSLSPNGISIGSSVFATLIGVCAARIL